jgi:hypothetical protein
VTFLKSRQTQPRAWCDQPGCTRPGGTGSESSRRNCCE